MFNAHRNMNFGQEMYEDDRGDEHVEEIDIIALGENPDEGLNFDPVSQMMGAWSSIEYGELSVVLAHVRHLYVLHQTHHWVSKGDPYYGDHLLFQRLYEETLELIDSVAERSVGLGSERNVNLGLQMKQIADLANSNAFQPMPTQNSLAQSSMEAVQKTVDVIDHCVASLDSKGQLTYGLDNLLAGVADVLEQHEYLLKRRMTP